MIRDMHMAFQIPYVYDYIIKLCSNKLKSLKIVKIYMFTILDKVKPDTDNLRSLISGGGQAYDRSSD
jgi:hypothetical protein